jgi:hypothetical protein
MQVREVRADHRIPNVVVLVGHLEAAAREVTAAA